MPRLFVRSRGDRSNARVRAADRVVGAFTGTVPASLDRTEAMEQWLDAPLDVQTVFEPWDTGSGAVAALFERLTAIWEAGRVPLVTWEPFTPTPAATPPDVLDRIVAGEYDDYLTRWGQALTGWLDGPDGNVDTVDHRRLYLRLMHEPNGDWYPWAPAGGDCTAATYVEAWHRVHRLITDEGATPGRVSWIWAVNHTDIGGVAAEDLFPGTAFVDLVGVDGFNWGGSQSWSEWQSPAEVFEEGLERLRSRTSLPVCVPEFGCTSVTVDGTDRGRKNRWLRDAFAYFDEQDVSLVSYFDVEKETDWQVFGGSEGENTIRIGGTRYQTYSGFRTGLRRYRYE